MFESSRRSVVGSYMQWNVKSLYVFSKQCTYSFANPLCYCSDTLLLSLIMRFCGSDIIAD